MKLLSIIIPVYNAEKYLKDCIDSILKQSFADFELLLIDDGSIDSSGLICDSYAQKDERVKSFHLENGGPSRARNYGMQEANGEYIEFVDADDQLCEDSLQKLAICANRNHPDMIIAGSEIWDSDNKKELLLPTVKSGVLDIQQYLRKITAESKSVLLHYIWNKWYRRATIESNKIIFDEDEKLGEDFIFNCRFFCCSHKNYAVEQTLYRYFRRNNGSLSAKFNPNELKRRRKMDSSLFELYEFLGLVDCSLLLYQMVGAITLASIRSVFGYGSPKKLSEKYCYVNSFLKSEYIDYLLKYRQASNKKTKSEVLALELLTHRMVYCYLLIFSILDGKKNI